MSANDTEMYICHGATEEETELYQRLAYALDGVGQVKCCCCCCCRCCCCFAKITLVLVVIVVF